jgi:acyl-CoA thioester hydrolase
MPGIYVKQFRVSEAAIDAHGHVNNQEYLRWLEEIAIEHSSAQGWTMERYLASGASWFVRSHFIEYLRPALSGDEIVAYTWVTAMEGRTSPRRTLFVRNADRPQVLAQAETVWAFVDFKTGRSMPVTEEVRSAFEIVASEDEVLRAAGLPSKASRRR